MNIYYIYKDEGSQWHLGECLDVEDSQLDKMLGMVARSNPTAILFNKMLAVTIKNMRNDKTFGSFPE